MIEILSSLMIGLASVVLIPICVFGAECVMALLPKRRQPSYETTAAPRIAVLIPAHNESLVITPTLSALMPTMAESDRVIVIADNCDDDTARLARRAGAIVIERSDTDRRGKAYALDFGVRYLANDPPDVVAVIDADCCVDPATIATIARRAQGTGHPTQSLNLCDPDRDAKPNQVLAGLGLRFKNLIRPLGLSHADLPCQLMGTGMAFPWCVIATAPLANSELAEDLRLGIELAISGKHPIFCPEARVTSAQPSKTDAFVTQRTRWEQGSLRTAIFQAPRLFFHGCIQRNPGLLCMALDLSVPPLSLLAMTWTVAMVAATVLWMVGGSAVPAGMLTAGGLLMVAVVGIGWRVFCRPAISRNALSGVPAYILGKLPIYLSFFFLKGQREWIRTERDSPAVQ